MNKKRVAIVGGVALMATLAVGASAMSANAGLSAKPEGGKTVWSKNASGVTYGSGMDALSPADEPDLIRVQATNGQVGYAYRSDLEGPEPTSPAAAVTQQKAKEGKPDIVPVYEVDGMTQIGVFVARTNDPQ